MAIKVAYSYKLCFNKSLDAVLECSSRYRSSTTRSQEFRSPNPGGDKCFVGSLFFLLSKNVLVFYYIKLCFIIENSKERLKNVYFQVSFFPGVAEW